jgi:hypothetical protein
MMAGTMTSRQPTKGAEKRGYPKFPMPRRDSRIVDGRTNKANGLRRTNEDKQRAAKAALAHPKSFGMSDRMLANYVGVHYNTVLEYRKQINPTITNSDSGKGRPRTGSDGRTINTADIGRKQSGGVGAADLNQSGRSTPNEGQRDSSLRGAPERSTPDAGQVDQDRPANSAPAWKERCSLASAATAVKG